MKLRGKFRACVALALALSSLTACAVAQPQQRDVSREQARPVRDWVRDGVIYEIYPRAFSAEGNFAGVTAQLGRLEELGVTILWLMPIHPLGQEKKKGTVGSPYAVRDFLAINPDYGTAADLKRLVSEAHRRRMRVIIDLVANHTAWDNVLMKQPEFYVRDASGKINSPHDWTDVAELNYASPSLRRYMIDAMKYWVREFDIDGYRCDVAFEVPTDFWEQARAELEQVKPDIVMLAESAEPELLVRAFDLDYAWPLHGTMNDVLQGRKPASAFRATWEEDARKYPQGALRMRFSDNHDERRAVARFGEQGALAASFLVFTLDGVPMLYNGMEVGDTTESGAPALFERLPVFWQTAERRPDFPRFYKNVIAFRKAHPALTRGELEWVHNSEAARLVTFIRRDASEELLIAINFSSQPLTRGSVLLPTDPAFTDVTPQWGQQASSPAPDPSTPAGPPTLSLGPWGFKAYKRPPTKPRPNTRLY